MIPSVIKASAVYCFIQLSDLTFNKYYLELKISAIDITVR